MLIVTPEIKVPLSEIEFTYVRSSGPGGQNVNKVNSKAILRWNVLESPSLPEHVRTLFLNKLASKITFAGEIVLSSDRFRDQGRNKEDCLEKLRKCLSQAAEKQKVRKKTKASKSSKRRAKEEKNKQSQKKSLRRSPKHDN